jgi:hypothetical protein
MLAATAISAAASADENRRWNPKNLRHKATVGELVQVTGTSILRDFPGCSDVPGGFGTGTNVIDSEVEPWFAVNPRNTRNLVAFWQQDRWSNGGARSNVAGVSFDGGNTWEQVVVPGITTCNGGVRQRASDPWVSFGPDGVVHQVSLIIDRDPPDPADIFGFGPNGLAVSRSNDGGLTWTDPILVVEDTDSPGILNDKQSLTADPTDARLVYVIWDRFVIDDPSDPNSSGQSTLLFTRSTDGGKTWQSPATIFDHGPGNETLGGQILVGPDGTLYAFFNKIVNFNPDDTMNPQPQAFRLTVLRSHDKGATWDSPGGGTEIAVMLAAGTVTPDTATPIRDGAILFDVAVDKKTGALYAVWQDYRFKGVEEIAFSQSLDGGRTWSNPIAVNRTPRNREKPFRQQALLPSVAVARDGTVGVSYYDFRNDDASGELADHWLVQCRRACDRPASWNREVRLTDTSFDYALAPFAGGLFIGDYVGLDTAGNDFLAFFTQAVSEEDPSSAFFRRVKGKRFSHRKISKRRDRDDD